jgi:hypothetical protein
VAKVVDCLPSKGEALCSVPSTRKEREAEQQRLTPVILATQEAEIRRMAVQSQTRANNPRDPISKKPSQKRAGGVAHGEDPDFKPRYSKINK